MPEYEPWEPVLYVVTDRAGEHAADAADTTYRQWCAGRGAAGELNVLCSAQTALGQPDALFRQSDMHGILDDDDESSSADDELSLANDDASE